MSGPERRASPGEEVRRELLFALAVQGPAASAEVARLAGRSERAVLTCLGALRSEGLLERVEAPPGGYALTAAGRAAARRARREEAEALRDAAAEAYPRFAELNRSVKAALTRWQLRRMGGMDVPNDHRDAAHDAAVLAELEDAASALAPLLADLARRRPRYRAYRVRLERALEGALAGQRDLVTGVGADSFHAVWWQLHADLLAVLGRRRGGEDA